jgi:hypothetical protein
LNENRCIHAAWGIGSNYMRRVAHERPPSPARPPKVTTTTTTMCLVRSQSTPQKRLLFGLRPSQHAMQQGFGGAEDSFTISPVEAELVALRIGSSGGSVSTWESSVGGGGSMLSAQSRTPLHKPRAPPIGVPGVRLPGHLTPSKSLTERSPSSRSSSLTSPEKNTSRAGRHSGRNMSGEFGPFVTPSATCSRKESTGLSGHRLSAGHSFDSDLHLTAPLVMSPPPVLSPGLGQKPFSSW